MEHLSKIVTALSSFAWPGLVGFVLYKFRGEIGDFCRMFRRQIAVGASLKFRDFEFKGFNVSSFDSIDGTGFTQVEADKQVFDNRHRIYNSQRNLFLAHRTMPTGRVHSVTGLPTYDISVYLISHKNIGRLNDVREVQYYFGQHFGLKQFHYGTKYVVTNGNENFAVKINAYGPTLCEARVVFQDGAEVIFNRYLDFEGTDYRFQPQTIQADLEKIQNRQEEPTSRNL